MQSAGLVPNELAIARRIHLLGDQLMLLDVDLAQLFGVAVERLVQLVLQSQPKISVEFAFFIEPDEIQKLVPRITASYANADRRRFLAVTEHGVMVAAAMLNNERAIETSIAIVRVFVRLREDDGLLAMMTPELPSHRELH